MRSGSLARAVAGWRSSAGEQRRMGQVCGRMVRRLQSVGLARAMSRWAACVSHAATQLEASVAMERQRARGCAQRAWGVWEDSSRQERRTREVGRKVRGRTKGRAWGADTRRARPAGLRRGRWGPLTFCGMASKRMQPTGRGRRPCRRDRAHVRGEKDKVSALGRQGGQASGRGLGDRVRAWQDHGTCAGHDARSACGYRRGRRGPLTACGMTLRRTQQTGRGRRP